MSLITRPDLLQVVNKPSDLSKLVSKGLIAAYDFKVKGDSIVQDITQPDIYGGAYGMVGGTWEQTLNGIRFPGRIETSIGGVRSVVALDGNIGLLQIYGVRTICMSVKIPPCNNDIPLLGESNDESRNIIAGPNGGGFTSPFSNIYINGEGYLGIYGVGNVGYEPWLNLVFTVPVAPIDYPGAVIANDVFVGDIYGSFEIRDLRFYSKDFTLQDAQDYSNALSGFVLLENFDSTTTYQVTEGSFNVLSNGSHGKKQFNYLNSTGTGVNRVSIPSASNNGYDSILIKKAVGSYIEWVPTSETMVDANDPTSNCIKVVFHINGTVGIFNIRDGQSVGGYETDLTFADDVWHEFILENTSYGQMYLFIDGYLILQQSQYGWYTPGSNDLTPAWANIRAEGAGCGFAELLSRETSIKNYNQLYDTISNVNIINTKYNQVSLEAVILRGPQSVDSTVVWQRSTDGLNFSIIGESSSVPGTFVDTTVLPETNYWYSAYLKRSNNTTRPCIASETTTPAQTFPMILRLVITNPNTSIQWYNPSGSGSGYNYFVDFGDNSAPMQVYTSGFYSHTYAQPGTYLFSVDGLCTGFTTANTAFRTAIRQIVDWGLTGAKNYSFNGCSQLTSVPSDTRGSFATWTTAVVLGSTGVATIPNGFLNTAVNITSAAGMFQNNQSVTSIPNDLFKYCPMLNSISSMFNLCANLRTVPVRMITLATNPLVSNFGGAFRSCTSMVGSAPTWWLDYPSAVNTYFCFYPDTQLTNYLSIPDPWGGVQIPLEAPINLSITDVVADTATATWTNIETGVDQSEVQASFDGTTWDGGSVGYAFGDTQTASLFLNPDTHYWCRIVNMKGVKISPPSNVVDFTTPVVPPPIPPSNFTMAIKPGTDGSVVDVTLTNNGFSTEMEISGDGLTWTTLGRFTDPPFGPNDEALVIYAGQHITGPSSYGGYNKMVYARARCYNSQMVYSNWVSGNLETLPAPMYTAPALYELSGDVRVTGDQPGIEFWTIYTEVIERSDSENGTYIEVATRPPAGPPYIKWDIGVTPGLYWYRTRNRYITGEDGTPSAASSIDVIG
jgi:hypothetical protein